MARVLRRLAPALTFLVAVLALFTLASPALAFTPPPLHGHVVDTAGALTEQQIAGLDHKLDDVRLRTGFAIVAFVTGSLDGESVDDVAYQTFNAWHVGEKGKDNGVLLLIAPRERKTRIETGKGVEGALTDLQTDDIRLQVVQPALERNRIFDAVDRGTTAIARTLSGEAVTTPAPRHAPPPAAQPLSLIKLGFIAGGLLLVILLAIVSPAFRSFLWFFLTLFFFRGRGGGGGFGGGGGGSGYSGGGGESGGGGSSGSY